MILLFVFAAAAFVQISFWIAMDLGLRRASAKTDWPLSGSSRGVTVVVAEHENEEDLAGIRHALSQQTYAPVETLFVDGRTGKKDAIARGVRDSTYDTVAFTDVDCRPGPEWLASLARHFDRPHPEADAPDLVIGYGPYAEQAGWLNRLIRYETLSTALLTAASVGFDRPYMAVGRNLVVDRVTALEALANAKGSGLISGSDDLLVQSAVRRQASARYAFDPRSFVTSDPVDTVTEWIRQKRRHYSASRAYPLRVSALLSLFHLTAILTWIAPLALGWIGAAMLTGKLLAQWPLFAIWARRFEENGLTAALPFLDLNLLVTQFLLAPIAILSPPKRW